MVRPGCRPGAVVTFDRPFPKAPAFQAVRLLTDPGFVAGFRPRVVSSSLAVPWVAAGRRAAYVTDGDLRDSVHFAAGIALCRAAGCTVTASTASPCTPARAASWWRPPHRRTPNCWP
ncbi:inositol monophosphatase family protein [Streptomyces sp. Ac-502]|uniref:inositol monophosphatase family protein n=1 Tax=Streptomyces sp. Ac-502 TaxID=3342801 RepID=UPI0038629571